MYLNRQSTCLGGMQRVQLNSPPLEKKQDNTEGTAKATSALEYKTFLI